MSSSLDEWQTRLEQHFGMLAKSRSGSGLDIFALEHGLDDAAIAEIEEQLRLQLEHRLHLSQHWLLWVIYLTEHGYRYEGDEYWPSFEQKTPYWDRNRRYQVTQWFNKFQQTYNGVIPTGRWADYFSIISQPITHAILPKYFQVQFSRMLYCQRHRLIGLGALDASDIGKRLAGNADYAPARFQEFLQQEELTGRIVLALLGEQSIGGNEPIYPQTLERIVGDLERIRNAGEWLRETQRFVKDRFAGIAKGLPNSGGTGSRGEQDSRDMLQHDVRPKIYLSHRDGENWIVWVEVPSFKEIASLDVDIRAFLISTRCRINGADDFKPGGWLLCGNRKGVLKRWPDPQEPMIHFERPHGYLENLLQTGCRTISGPIWLYRIGPDGTASEIVGKIIRPRGKYVIVTSEERDQLRFGMHQIEIDCASIWAYRLDVPADVSAEFIEWLAGFKLQVARTIRVWPAGLPSRGWNGDGQSEWLTTETSFFGMVHDHPVDRYVLQLDGEPEIEIDAGSCGHPVFVKLPRLPAGEHILMVKTKRNAVLDKIVPTPAAKVHVKFHVREPEPWIPGVASHCGLIARLDPYDADLEALWRNEVNLSVIGPPSRSVSASIRLTDRKGNKLLCDRVGGRFKLPLSSEAWREKFQQFLRPEKHAWVYLEAAGCELEISAEELGRVSFRFEHDIPPLRWVLNRDQDNIVARLVDDTGIEETEPEVSFFSMKTPVLKCHQSPDAALAGQVVEMPGGLLCARQGLFEDFVAVSCKFTVSGFKDLNIESDFTQLRNSSVLSASILRLYARWHNARFYGPFINIRWGKIRKQYLSLIYEKVCGLNWAKAEASFHYSPDSQHAFEALLPLVEKKSTGFSTMLRRGCEQTNENVRHRSGWYAELAKKYHVCTDTRLSEFAFSLATEAHRVSEIFDSDLESLVDAVRQNPAVLRGARFLECAVSLTRNSELA